MDDVEIVDYDPRWPRLFDEEAERLRAVLDPSLIVGLEHFGSTAIAGLSAKPIIDILIAVRSLAAARASFQPAMRYFRRAAGATLAAAVGPDSVSRLRRCKSVRMSEAC